MVLPANLSKLKVDELRAELKARGLQTSGTKPALLKRLKAAVAAARVAPTEPEAAPAPAAEAAPAAEPTDAAPEPADAGADSMEERLKRRRERFGVVEKEPVAAREGKKAKEARMRAEFEAAKARRARKFSAVDPGVGALDPDEVERRLKRQRRFATNGQAA